MNRWQSFASLSWYDQAIEFLFRFVAKTSEPLLATGLVISAADYLSHGAVMAGNPTFSLAWSWVQALALESSSGVVFVYGLQAFKQQDTIKGGLYLALALLLAIVGGGMLLLQVNAVSMGSAETAVPVLNVLRVIVSISYIFLLRAKSIRFTDLQDVREQPAPEKMAIMTESTMDTLVSHVVARLVELEQPRIAEHAESRASETPHLEQGEPSQVSERFASKEQAIKNALAAHPGATPEELAAITGASLRTTLKWTSRIAKE